MSQAAAQPRVVEGSSIARLHLGLYLWGHGAPDGGEQEMMCSRTWACGIHGIHDVWCWQYLSREYWVFPLVDMFAAQCLAGSQLDSLPLRGH